MIASLIASASVAGDPIAFLIGFLLLICIIAVVIIGVRWLAQLSGVTIPPPLLMILGIIMFLVLLLFLLDHTGYYRW